VHISLLFIRVYLKIMSADSHVDHGPTSASRSLEENKCSDLCQFNKNQLESCNKNYVDLLTELFFLQHGGNYVDYNQFKKRPSQQLKTYLDQNVISGNCHVKQPAEVDTLPVQTTRRLSSTEPHATKEAESRKSDPVSST